MKVVAALVFALFVGCAAAFNQEDGVIVGTDATFQEILAENKYALVEWYAPWCGHCKSLAPEYVKAAAELVANEMTDVVLVKIDATVENKFSAQYDVSGYPTLKFFVDGEAQEYNGGRTAPEIIQWLKKKTGPAFTVVNSVAELEAFVAKNPDYSLGAFSSAESDEAVAFAKAAGVTEFAFAMTFDAAVATSVGAALPGVVVIKPEEEMATFSGDYESAAISKFVSGNALPLLITFSDELAPKIFGGAVKTHVILFMPKNDALVEASAVMRTVAKNHLGDALFIHIDSDAESHKRIMEFFGLTDSDLPAVRLISLGEDMAKFAPPSADLTTEVLGAFVADFFSGALKPSLKSQPLPEDWNALPCKVLTAENFAAVALDESKNVLVEFYAPWCGHCKQLAPIFDKLAEEFEDNDSVVIAKMDSTLNEIEGLKITGFPTLKFYPAGPNKEAVDYSGDRDLKGMTDYINKALAGTGAADADAEESHDEL